MYNSFKIDIYISIFKPTNGQSESTALKCMIRKPLTYAYDIVLSFLYPFSVLISLPGLNNRYQVFAERQAANILNFYYQLIPF